MPHDAPDESLPRRIALAVDRVDQPAALVIGYDDLTELRAAGAERVGEFMGLPVYQRRRPGWSVTDADGLRLALADGATRVLPTTDHQPVGADFQPVMTAEQMKRVRQAVGMSVNAFGQALGLSGTGRTVRKYESGERVITGPVANLVLCIAAGWRPAGLDHLPMDRRIDTLLVEPAAGCRCRMSPARLASPSCPVHGMVG